MLLKFDLLFHKLLKNGGEKVVTYKSILENPVIFGEGEVLAGTVGELSLCKEGTETVCSFNSLLQRNHSYLIGQRLSNLFIKEFPIKFLISEDENGTSLHSEIIDEDGTTHVFLSEPLALKDSMTLDLKDIDYPVAIVVKKGKLNAIAEGSSVCVEPGGLLFIPSSVKVCKLLGYAGCELLSIVLN